MAGSMKDIKLRIKSVESTRQITKAMQLVATSKLRRAKERMETSRPFAEISGKALAEAVRRCGPQSPYAGESRAPGRCYVVIAGDRGLAGGYNSNLFKALAAHAEGSEYCVLPIGRKAVERFLHQNIPCVRTDMTRVEGISVPCCHKMVKDLLARYLNGDFGEVWLVYTAFRNMMSQEVQLERLLPVVPAEDAEDTAPVDTIYELGPEETLEKIMPDVLTGRIYSALCDSFASEVAARRTAMDSATKNAGEMISDLTLRYNRARQGAITQEITEIVAGAEH